MSRIRNIFSEAVVVVVVIVVVGLVVEYAALVTGGQAL